MCVREGVQGIQGKDGADTGIQGSLRADTWIQEWLRVRVWGRVCPPSPLFNVTSKRAMSRYREGTVSGYRDAGQAGDTYRDTGRGQNQGTGKGESTASYLNRSTLQHLRSL